MAVYQAPADNRTQNFGRSMNQGLMMMMQNKLMQDRQTQRQNFISQQDVDKAQRGSDEYDRRLQIQKAMENEKFGFGNQMPSIDDIEGYLDGGGNPQFFKGGQLGQEGFLPAVENNIRMQGKYGYKPPNKQYQQGVVFDPSDGSTSGKHIPTSAQANAFSKNEKNVNTQKKLVQTLKKSKEGYMAGENINSLATEGRDKAITSVSKRIQNEELKLMEMITGLKVVDRQIDKTTGEVKAYKMSDGSILNAQ